jgi:hypothetical protein
MKIEIPAKLSLKREEVKRMSVRSGVRTGKLPVRLPDTETECETIGTSGLRTQCC